MPRRPRSRSPFKVFWRDDCSCWWVHFIVAGRRHRLSTGEPDRGQAEERAAALWQEAKARAGDPVPAGTVRRSLHRLAAELLKEVKSLGYAATYERDLEVDLRVHILPRWDSPEEVSSVGWEQARIDIHAEGQSWASVKRIGKHLRQLLRFCKRRGALLSVPEILSPEKKLIAREQSEREMLPRKDRDALLADMKKRGNARARRCYEVMFFNLFRKSTVERMLPSWFDFKARTVRVPPRAAKNSKARTYWLHVRTLRAVKEQMVENAKAHHGKTELGKPIFGKFDHSNVFWGACKRLGLVSFTESEITDKRGLTPHHVTRRTAATMLVEAGVSTKDRMAAGGWESVEAAERYDLPSEQVERSRRALKKLR